MSKTNPPDQWTPTAGTWGTHYDHDATVYRSGTASLKLKSVGTDGAFKYLTHDPVPVADGDLLFVGAWIRGSSRNEYDKVYLGLRFWDLSGTSMSPIAAFYGTVDVIDTWQKVSALIAPPSGAATAGPMVGKLDTSGFNVWVDEVMLRHAVVNEHVGASAGIVGTKLSATLDQISDGSSYRRLAAAGVTGGAVNTTGLVDGAVTTPKVGAAAVGVYQSVGLDTRSVLNRNANFLQRTRG